MTDRTYSDEFGWRCSNRSCSNRFSLKLGSLFQNSKFTVMQILSLSYWWVYELQAPDDSDVLWYYYFRDLCLVSLHKSCQKEAQQIGGEGEVVEIDDQFNSDIGLNQFLPEFSTGIWVVGAIERKKNGRGFLEVMQERLESELKSVILKRIAPGSIIVSKQGYSDISGVYRHFQVLDDEKCKGKFKNPVPNALPKIKYHYKYSWYFHKYKLVHEQGINSENLSSHFAEYIFRLKFLKDATDPFKSFLRLGVSRVFTLDMAMRELNENKSRPLPVSETAKNKNSSVELENSSINSLETEGTEDSPSTSQIKGSSMKPSVLRREAESSEFEISST